MASSKKNNHSTSKKSEFQELSSGNALDKIFKYIDLLI